MQERRKWEKPQRNVAKGDIVLLVEETAPQCDWPLGRIMETQAGDDGLVRKVKVKAKGTIYERPIHKLIPLLVSENSD
jgi:hypothetical protein